MSTCDGTEVFVFVYNVSAPIGYADGGGTVLSCSVWYSRQPHERLAHRYDPTSAMKEHESSKVIQTDSEEQPRATRGAFVRGANRI